jgi:hypothetical protein
VNIFYKKILQPKQSQMLPLLAKAVALQKFLAVFKVKGTLPPQQWECRKGSQSIS